MLRYHGARLAVPLLLATTVILVGLEVGLTWTATALDGCRPTSDGIICGYTGSTSSGSSSSSTAPAPLPPLRYLATQGGHCWYWSRYPPGFDSWNSVYDHSIISTRWRLPECRSRSAPVVVRVVDASKRAWAVFRSFPLDSPDFHLTPAVGITNLPSRLHLEAPRRFRHTERLPDGRRLEVEATVEIVRTEWSDGTPSVAYGVTSAIGDPGAVRHTYLLKTCPADYRISHLDGSKCHPTLDRYPITVTYQWSARYRTGGSWIGLGSIDRPASIRYDVDEVLGVLQP